MLKYRLNVALLSFALGVFYGLAPLMLAILLEKYFPFGFDALTKTSSIRFFVAISFLVTFPVNIITAIRDSRYRLFQNTDCKPTLFGSVGTGAYASSVYKARAIAALVIAMVIAIGIAFIIISLNPAITNFKTMSVLWLLLVFVFTLLCASEFNSLRVIAKTGAV